MILKYTENYLQQVKKVISTINNADAILIGAGAGLSASAGMPYNGKRFQDNFSQFQKKIRIH